MATTLKQAFARRSTWGIGLLLLLAASLSAAVIHLNSLKAKSHELQAAVDAKGADLSRNLSATSMAASLVAARAVLGGWEEMAEDEARCATVLSEMAHAAGVTLVSLRSLEPREIAGAGVLAYPHEIRGRGDQRQIAEFLDQVYASAGMASIDELQIEPLGEEDPEHLEASLKVIWYAPADETEETAP